MTPRLGLACALAAACAGPACGPRRPPSPAEPAELAPLPPTREQCEAVVERLAGFMPEAMRRDRERDVSDCMDMPGRLVDCLGTAGSRRQADDCVNAYLGPPSRADCRDAIAHLRQLDPQFAEGAAEDAIDFCVAHKSRFELSCIHAAGSLREAAACERQPERGP